MPRSTSISTKSKPEQKQKQKQKQKRSKLTLKERDKRRQESNSRYYEQNAARIKADNNYAYWRRKAALELDEQAYRIKQEQEPQEPTRPLTPTVNCFLQRNPFFLLHTEAKQAISLMLQDLYEMDIEAHIQGILTTELPGEHPQLADFLVLWSTFAEEERLAKQRSYAVQWVSYQQSVCDYSLYPIDMERYAQRYRDWQDSGLPQPGDIELEHTVQTLQSRSKRGCQSFE